MIIGFLGKGGSGKSTLATAMVYYLHTNGKNVLAIDADHNMDLAYNLGAPETIPYLSNSINDLNQYSGLSDKENFKQIYKKGFAPVFSLTPPDLFTLQYSKELKPHLRLMASGPHTEEILGGEKCSHSLSTSLKVYLPFLKLEENDVVIIDEKASSDAAGTGTPTGFTLTYIVTESTPHAIKAAHQIADTLDYYGAPYEFVLNKIENDDQKTYSIEALRKPPLTIFKKNRVQEDIENLLVLTRYPEKIEKSNLFARLERSRRKFLSLPEFAS
jgi:CO dehydrogenase maturation factor